MTWEDVVAMNQPMVPRPPTQPKPELCGDTTGYGYEDTVSCEKPKGHDDPGREIGGVRQDPIHQETIPGNPTQVVTWWYS